MKIAEWMARLCQPGQCVELRALAVGNAKALSRHFIADAKGLVVLEAQAVAWESQNARGIYWTPNPVRSDLGEGASARNEDVLARRWLLVDIDPVRPADLSSTDGEKAAAWIVADRCRRAFVAAGWPEPVMADSGNGWHLLLPYGARNDEGGKALCRTFLHGVSARLSTDAAKVDTTTHNAARIVRLYGSLARKGDGSTERPHRRSAILSLPAWLADADQDKAFAQGALAMAGMMDVWRRSEAMRGNRPEGGTSAYAISALRKECQRVAAAGTGERNNTLNAAAYSIAQLVAGGHLDHGKAVSDLAQAARQSGLGDAEIQQTLGSAFAAGQMEPRRVPAKEAGKPGQATPPAADSDDDPIPEEVGGYAKAADLIAAGASIAWAWPGWIAQGVMTVIGAEGGTGKTRFCMDLMRRTCHGLPWPDGAPMTLASDARWLWMLADDHHAEAADLVRGWNMEEPFFVPAPKSNPFIGTRLDGCLPRIEKAMEVLRPTFLVIDTLGSATQLKMTASDETELLCRPLRKLARQFNCAVLALTHLNAEGKILGRRVIEKARQVLLITEPDRDGQPNRRRLWVDKSNAQKPPPLGVTMGDAGNEYDTEPPTAEQRGPGPRTNPKRDVASCWLREALSRGPRQVMDLRSECEALDVPIPGPTLYRAKNQLGVEEYKDAGRKWWRLPESESPGVDQAEF